MLSAIPDSMISLGYKSVNFYKKNKCFGNRGEDREGRLMEEEEYNAAANRRLSEKDANASKARYFEYRRLSEILFSHHSRREAVRGEDRLLGQFSHFLSQCLCLDPWDRITAGQAASHPFLVGDNLDGGVEIGIRECKAWKPPVDGTLYFRKLLGCEFLRLRRKRERREMGDPEDCEEAEKEAKMKSEENSETVEEHTAVEEETEITEKPSPPPSPPPPPQNPVPQQDSQPLPQQDSQPQPRLQNIPHAQPKLIPQAQLQHYRHYQHSMPSSPQQMYQFGGFQQPPPLQQQLPPQPPMHQQQHFHPQTAFPISPTHYVSFMQHNHNPVGTGALGVDTSPGFTDIMANRPENPFAPTTPVQSSESYQQVSESARSELKT